jgi:hypothetical protein
MNFTIKLPLEETGRHERKYEDDHPLPRDLCGSDGGLLYVYEQQAEARIDHVR